MPIKEMSALLTRKDADGTRVLIYPVTRLENVDDSEFLVRSDTAQELTDKQKAQARENLCVYSIEETDTLLAGIGAEIITTEEIDALID